MRKDRNANSIDVALVAFVRFELFDVFVRLLFGLAALLLNDLAQRRINVLGHATGVAAHEKVRAFPIEPFPDFGCVVQHFVLHVRFLGRITRPRQIKARQKSIAPLLLNHANRGELWADYGITADRVRAYNAHIADGAPDLWAAAQTLIADAAANGWFAQ